MSVAHAIASNTFRESIRQPVYWAVVLLTASLMMLSVIFAGFALGEESKLVRDAGLTSITIAGLLLAMFLSSNVVADEIEKKTALSVLCKPVHRYQFIVGKYIGICCSIVIAYIILTLILYGTVWWYESPIRYGLYIKAWWAGQPINPQLLSGEYPEDIVKNPITTSLLLSTFGSDISSFFTQVFPNLLTGVFLSLCEVAVLTSAAVAISTRVSMILNVCITLSLFIVGHQIGYFMHILSGGDQPGVIATLVRRLVPNFEFLNYASDIAFGKVVPITLVEQSALYTLGWVAVFLALAVVLFDEREIA